MLLGPDTFRSFSTPQAGVVESEIESERGAEAQVALLMGVKKKRKHFTPLREGWRLKH